MCKTYTFIHIYYYIIHIYVNYNILYFLNDILLNSELTLI